MKNDNNKGFFLVETLVVTTVVSLAMVFLYSQLLQVLNAYELRTTYNTVDGMYALYNVNDYIIADNMYSTLTTDASIAIDGYLEFDCTDFSNLEYCTALFTELDIKNIFVTEYNTSLIKTKAPADSVLSDGVKLFVSNITKVNNAAVDEYRLIVEFNNNTYASSKLNVEDDVPPVITGSEVIFINVGETYNPSQGLVATDNIYGDISDNIVCTLSAGTTYNCWAYDSNGNESTTFIRTIIEN